jgi:hypothetical protein
VKHDALSNVLLGDPFELLNFHLYPFFGERAAVQVDVSIAEVWPRLELIRSVQQQAAQVTGVFEVVRSQLEMATQIVCHFALVVRSTANGSVLIVSWHCLYARIKFSARTYFNARKKYMQARSCQPMPQLQGTAGRLTRSRQTGQVLAAIIQRHAIGQTSEEGTVKTSGNPHGHWVFGIRWANSVIT